MIVSHKHKFIFLKTMKTASTSMEVALSSHLGPDDIITPARPDLEVRRERGVGGQNYRLDHPAVPKIPIWRKILRRPERYYHPTVGFYEHMPAWRVKAYLGDEIWDSYYKFAFERNPWDRQLSYYFYKNRGKQQKTHFTKFLKDEKRSRVDNFNIYTIDGVVSVDRIGLYENINSDFEKNINEIGFEEDILLPKENTSENSAIRSYRDYYDEETKNIVARRYAKEIELFGYEF